MSFRTRLVLAAAYLVAAVVLALEIPLALSIERRADSDFQTDVLGRAALLAARISDEVAATNQGAPNASTGALIQAVDDAAAAVDERIVVTNDRGHLLVDSAGQAAPGSTFATAERPEFGSPSRRGASTRAGASARRPEAIFCSSRSRSSTGARSSARCACRPRASLSSTACTTSWLRLAAIGLAVVAGAFVLAWILATTVSRPLGRLRDTAGELGGGDLDARAPTDGPAELAALGISFNRMADALGSSMRAQRDFVANASHQLRTPLTGIKLRLEAIRAEGGAAGENAEKAEEELDRLEALVDDLLALAGRGDAAASRGSPSTSPRRLEDAVERWQAPAGEAEKTVEAGRLEQALVFADPADLAHVVDNLIENALRYAPPGTQVTVESASENGRGTLVVADDGPGIPEEERARVFERFYRGSNGRTSRPGNRARARDRRGARRALGRRGDPRRRARARVCGWSSARRLPIADRGFTDSEDGRCYVQSMRRVTHRSRRTRRPRIARRACARRLPELRRARSPRRPLRCPSRPRRGRRTRRRSRTTPRSPRRRTTANRTTPRPGRRRGTTTAAFLGALRHGSRDEREHEYGRHSGSDDNGGSGGNSGPGGGGSDDRSGSSSGSGSSNSGSGSDDSGGDD